MKKLLLDVIGKNAEAGWGLPMPLALLGFGGGLHFLKVTFPKVTDYSIPRVIFQTNIQGEVNLALFEVLDAVFFAFSR